MSTGIADVMVTQCEVGDELGELRHFCSCFKAKVYRVTIQLVQNLPLTSKQKFLFCLDWPGLARPKRNFCFKVNGRFCTSRMVTL